MFEYPNVLDKIFEKLKKNSAKPIFVGGYVRDRILQIPSKDIDIEIYHLKTFNELKQILFQFGTINEVGKNFGVCKMNFEDFEVDFSLPRLESKVMPGHKGFDVDIYPDMSFKEASKRRDFTINAIGYDPFELKFLDPYGGIDDLKNKRLHIVDKKTFIEDPLRVLRGMQFCARFELACSDETLEVSKYIVHNNMLKELSKERIFEEFKKLFLRSKKISIGLEFLKRVDGFRYFKELEMEEFVWRKTIDSLDRYITNTNKPNITVTLALLCYEMDEIRTKLFLSKISAKSLLKSINKLKVFGYFFDKKIQSITYDIAKNIDLEMLEEFLLGLGICKDLSYIKPVIHGKDLIKQGLKPSKEFSKILDAHYKEHLNSIYRQ